MTVDWRACEEKLYAASVAAIAQLASDHAEEAICFFAFDSRPRYGYVLIAFDTLANNIGTAKRVKNSPRTAAGNGARDATVGSNRGSMARPPSTCLEPLHRSLFRQANLTDWKLRSPVIR